MLPGLSCCTAASLCELREESFMMSPRLELFLPDIRSSGVEPPLFVLAIRRRCHCICSDVLVDFTASLVPFQTAHNIHDPS